MDSLVPCQLFVDPPADGSWNMAVDEALLEQAADEGRASLRFYRWSKPTLSLGYFQRYADREQHAESRGAAAVRRISGGGALMHDRELTYCLCLPASHPRTRQSALLYGLAHEELIAVFAEQGLCAHLYSTNEAARSPQSAHEEPFLCFARRTACDVVLSSQSGRDPKVVGSAQRRRRGAVLQHGSVLLDASACAPELPGLTSAHTAEVDVSALIRAWCERLAQRLNLQFSRAETAADIPLQLRQRLVTKYASDTWLKRR